MYGWPTNDYVLLPHDAREAFVDALRAEVASRYPSLEANPDYTRIVNGKLTYPRPIVLMANHLTYNDKGLPQTAASL